MLTADPYEVSRSDLGQSYVRLAIVAGVAGWSYYQAGRPPLGDIAAHGHLLLPIGYLLVAGLLLVWSAALERAADPGWQWILRRGIGLVADVAALSSYTAIAGGHALIVFPFFLTVIIGYGYRFGLPYLYSAIAAGLIGFTFAYWHNPAFVQAPVLVAAYYLGLAIVPVYSVLLLRRHQQVLARLREVDAARTRFIAHISHELRTPLHAIISAASLLDEELALTGVRSSERAPHAKLRIITEAADHLLTLVNRVLDLAAAGAGSLRLETGTVDVYRVVRAAIAICRPAAEARGIDLFWHVAANCPRWITSSAPHLQEILINTLGNAIKFTYAGSVSLHVGAVADRLRLVIRDTGTGLTPQARATLFQPFALSDGNAARPHGGTGLGLAITKQYVEALTGHIVLRAAEDHGTVCEIELPLSDAPQTVAPAMATRLRAALLSERPPTTDERGWFAAGGWQAVQVPPGGMRDAAARFSDVRAVIVDERLTSAATGFASRFGDVANEIPLALWQRDGAPAGALAPQFNLVLRAGSLDDLHALSGLATCQTVTAASVAVTASVRSLRLLVVDDNDTNLRTARMALEAAGHSVDLARDGDEALRALAAAEFDLVVIDMHMPGTTGIDVIRRLHAPASAPAAPPAILLTADFTDEAHAAGIAAGAAAVLTKPILPDALRAAVIAHARVAAGPDDPAPPLVDAAFATEMFADCADAASATELIERFAEEATIIMTRLRNATAASDAERARRELHRLKGCCAAMGARALSEAAANHERLSDEQLLAAVDAIVTELSRFIEPTTAALRLATRQRASAA